MRKAWLRSPDVSNLASAQDTSAHLLLTLEIRLHIIPQKNEQSIQFADIECRPARKKSGGASHA
jgi:hypothetical protein